MGSSRPTHRAANARGAVLIGYGAGDVVDRVSVLGLKIFHHGPKSEWVREHAALVKDPKLEILVRPTLRVAAIALAAVNGVIWGLEDQIRAFRVKVEADDPPNPADVAHVGMQIQAENDHRQEFVTQLNGGDVS